MEFDSILYTNGQVRPIWRFFASVGLVFASTLVVGVLLGLIFGVMGKRPGNLESLCWAHLALLPVLLGACKILTAFFEKKPLGSIGLAPAGRWQTELGLGLVVGAAMILALAGLEVVAGLGKFGGSGVPPGQAVLSSLGFALVLFVAATNEEMMFRGYPFQRLVESVGPWGAVAVTSGLFAVVHLGNPSADGISTLNTALVGVPLAVAYLRTRLLWMPIGIHFAWNYVQGVVLGLPVSGLVIPQTVLRAEVEGARWLTGGRYGPEGGLLASGIIIAATVYLLLSKRIYTSEETKKLVFGSAPAGAATAESTPLSGSSSESAHSSIGGSR